MQSHAAVFRTGDVLKEGCVKMEAIYKSLDDIKTFDRGLTLHIHLIMLFKNLPVGNMIKINLKIILYQSSHFFWGLFRYCVEH